MSDDELLAIYGSIRKLATSMEAREAALEQRTVALDASIARLEQLPVSVGKQTGQYIAMGVRQSIQEDFRLPVAEAVKPPLLELHRAAAVAQRSMAEIGKEARFQTWTWLGCIFLLGILIGALGCYWLSTTRINAIQNQLDSLQQQVVAPATPMSIPALPTHKKKHEAY